MWAYFGRQCSVLENIYLFIYFSPIFIARQHAKRELLYRFCHVRMPVRTYSVCRTMILYLNEWTYRQSFSTFCCGHTSSFWASPPLQIQRNAVTRAWNTQGWGKLRFFDRNRPLSRKRYDMGPWLLWITNRKSWVVDRSVLTPMTLSDLERRNASSFFPGRSPYVRSYRLM